MTTLGEEIKELKKRAPWRNGNFFHIFDLVKREAPEMGPRLLSMSVLSGASNALVLGIINAGSTAENPETPSPLLFLMFITTMALFIVSNRFILVRSIVMAENIVNRIRIRLADKVRHSELLKLEELGRAQIYTRITQETQAISQAAPFLIDSCQNVIVVFFCLVYIAWLSPVALLVTCSLVACGIAYYLSEKKIISEALRQATQKEIEFFASLSHVLDGFKEIRVNQSKSDGVFSHLQEIAASTRSLKISTGVKFSNVTIFSQSFFYILIGVLVFIMPQYSDTFTDQLVRITAAILFLIGPLSNVVASIQVFALANVAVVNIYGLEMALGEIEQAEKTRVIPRKFQGLILERVTFAYRDQAAQELFSVGPLNFAVRPNETLFIVGGNGSGKSTFLKLLTGYYPPDTGVIRWGGDVLGRENLPLYRELFSPIFTDYHLFDRLYGLENVDEDRVSDLLKLMQLDRKTAFRDGKFTHQDLSGGQKKRLALVVAMLDDKPIHIFDEWAADQDPPFRRYFYEEMLADFKKRGKTVIAVTHDDKYFHVADRVLKMDYGQMVENGATQ